MTFGTGFHIVKFYHSTSSFNKNPWTKGKKKCSLFTHGAPRSSQELVQKCPCIPGSNWNLEMLVFKEMGKPEYPEKKLLEQSREPTTNSTHIWRRVQEWNPGHIDGRWALSPLRHPCSLAGFINVFSWTGQLAFRGKKIFLNWISS